MKKCLTSLIIKEMQNKTTMRYYLTSIKMAFIKMTKGKCCKDVEKRELFCTVGGKVNWHHHHGKYYKGSSKINKYVHTHIHTYILPYISAILLWSI